MVYLYDSAGSIGVLGEAVKRVRGEAVAPWRPAGVPLPGSILRAPFASPSGKNCV